MSTGSATFTPTKTTVTVSSTSSGKNIRKQSTNGSHETVSVTPGAGATRVP